MFCKVCGKHLYESLDMRVLFKWNYEIHIECLKILDKEWEYEVVPIENNEIHHYYFLEKKFELNQEFLWENKVLELIQYVIKEKDWSVLFFYDSTEYDILPDIDLYLMFNLANKRLIYISIFI